MVKIFLNETNNTWLAVSRVKTNAVRKNTQKNEVGDETKACIRKRFKNLSIKFKFYVYLIIMLQNNKKSTYSSTSCKNKVERMCLCMSYIGLFRVSHLFGTLS